MSLVCWSGGCDSTLALYNLLMWSPKGCVRALSFVHPQIGAQAEQRRARSRIKRELRRRGLVFQHVTAGLLQTGGECSDVGSDGVSVQPVLWMLAAAAYLQEDESLVFGYIRGDDIWRVREPFESLFVAAQKIAGRSGALHLPFEHMGKKEVLHKLRLAKLLRLTWSCEEPTRGRPCGRCRSCESRKGDGR